MLPRFIMIKPRVCSGYICYSTETSSKFIGFQSSPNVFDPYAKIEVEIAKTNPKYVHLRFFHSNRYWARSEDDKWIVAVSKQPEEDTSLLSCTLFEPTLGCDGDLYFTHVQSRRPVKTDLNSACIFVADKGHVYGYYVFSFVDWNTLVKIPDRVSFKGDNNMYIDCCANTYLAATSSESKKSSTAYDVISQPDGHVRIKSVGSGKFWRCDGGKVVVDSTAGQKNDLFWPVKIDDHTVALRSEASGKFFNRSGDYLEVSADSTIKEAKFVVEELVLARKIKHVTYRMEDARVYDEKVYVAGTGSATNESDQESFIAITLTYQLPHSYSFTNAQSSFRGLKITIEAGIPDILFGKIEVSDEVTNTLEWGSTITEQRTSSDTYVAKVPPKSRVRVNGLVTEGKCSVPFNYAQLDQDPLYEDVTLMSRYLDGLFHGISSYNFKFEELPAEPL